MRKKGFGGGEKVELEKREIEIVGSKMIECKVKLIGNLYKGK